MLAAFLGLLVLIFVKPVFAGESPILITPANNSTVASIPTFSWQAVSGSTGYNILIDDEPTVISPYAKTPYYPTNPSYSPKTLNPGTYYWKVKAKDSSGNWGSFSSIWSFTLSSSNPTSTPTPSPTPTPLASTVSPTSSFTISNIPSQINSDQSFSAAVNLSLPNNPNTNFYLKGAFKKLDSSNYFGQTKVSGNWVKNGSSYSSQYQIITDSSGNWSGNLEVQPDSGDSGFTGSDDYIFKIGRYTSSGSGPTWSSEATIKIISAGSDQGRTLTDISSPTTSPSSSPSNQPKSYDKLIYHNATVAGAEASASTSASTSTKVAIKNQKQTTPIFWVGLIFIFAGIGSIGYIYLKKNGKIPI